MTAALLYDSRRSGLPADGAPHSARRTVRRGMTLVTSHRIRRLLHCAPSHWRPPGASCDFPEVADRYEMPARLPKAIKTLNSDRSTCNPKSRSNVVYRVLQRKKS
jgi:hypothetical protein